MTAFISPGTVWYMANSSLQSTLNKENVRPFLAQGIYLPFQSHMLSNSISFHDVTFVFYLQYRHSEPKMRPLFAKILMDLRFNQQKMLSWSAEDLATAPSDATVLGGSLSAGNNLFVLLQNTYKS